ncbi:ABC transporter permease subunit [Actinomyces timonensis]|uniref:ABC transporter permease subunit n=1 Tax=Actinomyces timonensis TaxID=1288391 RepID=A0AAU8N6H0_9ACTO
MTWILASRALILSCLESHLAQALPAIVAALLITIPLARLAQRARPLRGLITTAASLLYAIPSLALFVILPIILATGIRSTLNVVVALALYALALLVPATVEALDAVDHRALDAATAMGMGRLRRFTTVELPLAGPAILAALRVTTVSTISLTTVGAVLGVRSLGWLFTDGIERGVWPEIITGVLLTALTALLVDLLIVAGGRLLMPWSRGGGARAGRAAA